MPGFVPGIHAVQHLRMRDGRPYLPFMGREGAPLTPLHLVTQDERVQRPVHVALDRAALGLRHA